jgi:hypothetical protein
VQTSFSEPVQGVHLQKEAIVLEALEFFVMPVPGLHIDLDQLVDEPSTP